MEKLALCKLCAAFPYKQTELGSGCYNNNNCCRTKINTEGFVVRHLVNHHFFTYVQSNLIMQALPKVTSWGHSSTIEEHRNRNGTPWALTREILTRMCTLGPQDCKGGNWDRIRQSQRKYWFSLFLSVWFILFTSWMCCCCYCYTVCFCNKRHPSSSGLYQPQCHPFHLLVWIFFCFFCHHTLDWMTHLEGTLKCTLGLREKENDPVGEFLCITGHYTSGLRATQPPLTKMRDQRDHFLPGSNERNVECMFRGDGFRCSMSGNYKGHTLDCSTESINNALPRSNF